MRMFRAFRGAVVLAVLMACAVSGQSLGKASRISLARVKQVATRISQVDILRNIAKGFEGKVREAVLQPRAALEAKISTSLIRKVESTALKVSSELDRALLEDRKTSKAARQSVPFGPHLLVNPAAREIARAGAIFQEASLTAAKGLKLGRSGAGQLKNLRKLRGKVGCPFKKAIQCDATAKYRSMDGSCNNLKNPIWGRANTPFGRFLPSQYDDGFTSPRAKSVLGSPLPLARLISTKVHSQSSVADLHPDITHLAMEFGQIVSHDVNRNTLSSGYGGGSLLCCRPDGSIDPNTFKKFLGCLPIKIPANDPFFSQYSKTCMNFVRASPTSDIDCNLGSRQQLNQVSHYIDASTVYGSDVATMNALRTKSNGLLKVTSSANGDLLLQNPASTGTPGCKNTGTQHCFKAGDVRVNQQPGLMTLHTIFLREHNRIARQLKTVTPSWNDEKLFQESRRVVIAEMQHVTYTEYLPTILGSTFAGLFGFVAQPAGSYYSGYDETFNPSIRNSFAAGAYRFGHSTVRNDIAPGHLLKNHFLNPATMYQSAKGPSFVTKSLTDDRQHKTDNLMTDQLTNHLFERAAGTGIDLAATNIQRGRDHGLADYNVWRIWCVDDQAAAAVNFGTGPGGLVDHEPAIAALLGSVYQHPDDIDLWTGIVTETPLEGRAVGPTGACLIARQFWILKNADRFYYETDNAHVKFENEQLDEIRKTSLARIICDNTDITQLPADAFEKPSTGNPKVQCSTLPKMDLSQWKSCVDRQWGSFSSYSPCVSGFRSRRRRCSPAPLNVCGNPCQGTASQLDKCGGGGGFQFPGR